MIGKNEILKAYSDNTQILKEMYKSIKHIAMFATQIDKNDIKELKSRMIEILKRQIEMKMLIDRKLDLDVWQKVNRKKSNKK